MEAMPCEASVVSLLSQAQPTDAVDHAADFRRLVRLCAAITRRWEIAEDLAQETLLEAHRHQHKLYDATGRERWLAAIARHVCQRWLRRTHWERLTVTSTEVVEPAAPLADLDASLEQQDLTDLLQRALDR